MSSESVSTRSGKQGASKYKDAASRQLKTASSRRRNSTGSVKSKSTKGQALQVTGVSSLSVFRVCLVFYSLIFFVVLVAMVILWQFFASSGLEAKANHLIDSLLGSATYHIQGVQVAVIFVGVGVVGVVIISAITVIGARIFNLVAELIGGVTIYVRSGGSTKG